MFGLLQSCIYPRTFHLIGVRNAMTSGVGIINEVMLIINILLGIEMEYKGLSFTQSLSFAILTNPVLGQGGYKLRLYNLLV